MSSHTTSVVLRNVDATAQCHAHDHVQVMWGFEGQVEFKLEGRDERLLPGRALVIAPRQHHEFAAPRGARCFVLSSCDDAHLERLAPWAGTVRTGDASLGHLLRYLASLPALSGAAAELLLASLADSRERVPPGSRRPIDWPALQAWIDTRLADVLDVRMLAAQVHLSMTQFAARCVAELGLTPMALVRRQRLGAALRLRDAGLPIATIAARCGYRSPSALTAALKRETIGR